MQTVNYVWTETRLAKIASNYYWQLTKALSTQRFCCFRNAIDINYFKIKALVFYCLFGGVALNAIVTSVNSNAHDLYFCLK